MNEKKKETKNKSEEIYQLFKSALTTDPSWISIWSILAEHETFQRILGATVFRILRRYNMPLEWSDDISQEAMIYFAGILQRKPDLGFDESKSKFTTWLGTIINGCCLKAIRQFKDSLRQRLQVFPNDSVTETIVSLEKQIDFMEQVNQLEDKYRVPLFEYWNGVSIDEIAKEFNTSERTIYRRVETGIEMLKKKLAI